jgi:hypothetical protein
MSCAVTGSHNYKMNTADTSMEVFSLRVQTATIARFAHPLPTTTFFLSCASPDERGVSAFMDKGS